MFLKIYRNSNKRGRDEFLIRFITKIFFSKNETRTKNIKELMSLITATKKQKPQKGQPGKTKLPFQVNPTGEK